MVSLYVKSYVPLPLLVGPALNSLAMPMIGFSVNVVVTTFDVPGIVWPLGSAAVMVAVLE